MEVGPQGMEPMKIRAGTGSHVHDVTIERENGFYRVVVDGKQHLVDVHKLEGDFYSLVSEGISYEVSVEQDGGGYAVRHGAAEQRVRLVDPGREARESRETAAGPQELTSMMPGKVVRVLVGEGDPVKEGQGVLVVEAMKMENEVASPKDGVVRSIVVEAGQAVESGAPLAVIE